MGGGRYGPRVGANWVGEPNTDLLHQQIPSELMERSEATESRGSTVLLSLRWREDLGFQKPRTLEQNYQSHGIIFVGD